jgi:hypothetical protein
MKKQPDPRVDNLVILTRGIKIPEQAGIRHDPKPSFN